MVFKKKLEVKQYKSESPKRNQMLAVKNYLKLGEEVKIGTMQQPLKIPWGEKVTGKQPLVNIEKEEEGVRKSKKNYLTETKCN